MGGITGSFSKSKSENTNNTSGETNPWAAQSGYLQDTFGAAQGAYEAKAGSGYYSGPTYAGLNENQNAGINGLIDWSNQNGQSISNGAQQAGAAGIGAMNSSIANANAAANGPGIQSSNIVSDAAQYANNPYMDGMVDSASRDVTRNLNENTLPTIDRAASAGGNLNSSRAGIAQGIAMRGAQDQVGDISANLRGQAYQNGLGMAGDVASQNASNAITANNQLQNAASMGLDYNQFAAQQGQQNQQNVIAAGTMQQQDQQGQYDANVNSWEKNDTRAMDLLNQYYGIVGGNNWGSSYSEKSNGTGKASGMSIGGSMKM